MEEALVHQRNLGVREGDDVALDVGYALGVGVGSVCGFQESLTTVVVVEDLFHGRHGC